MGCGSFLFKPFDAHCLSSLWLGIILYIRRNYFIYSDTGSLFLCIINTFLSVLSLFFLVIYCVKVCVCVCVHTHTESLCLKDRREAFLQTRYPIQNPQLSRFQGRRACIKSLRCVQPSAKSEVWCVFICWLWKGPLGPCALIKCSHLVVSIYITYFQHLV